MFREIVNLTVELKKRGLEKEAKAMGAILKKAQTTGEGGERIGRNQRLKILLKELLLGTGQRAAAESLNTKSDSWGKINSAFETFLKNITDDPNMAKAISTDWAGHSRSIGRGYRPTREGMIDMLSDFVASGRYGAGGSLSDATFVKDRTPEYIKSLDDHLTVTKHLDPLTDFIDQQVEGEPQGRAGRSVEYQDMIESTKRRLRRPSTNEVGQPQGEYLANNPSETESAARLSGDGVFQLGNWEQKRDGGIVTGYRLVGAPVWQTNIQHQMRNLDGAQIEQSVDPSSPDFYLALGPQMGETLVANIGHTPKSQNSWQKVED